MGDDSLLDQEYSSCQVKWGVVVNEQLMMDDAVALVHSVHTPDDYEYQVEPGVNTLYVFSFKGVTGNAEDNWDLSDIRISGEVNGSSISHGNFVAIQQNFHDLTLEVHSSAANIFPLALQEHKIRRENFELMTRHTKIQRRLDSEIVPCEGIERKWVDIKATLQTCGSAVDSSRKNLFVKVRKAVPI